MKVSIRISHLAQPHHKVGCVSWSPSHICSLPVTSPMPPSCPPRPSSPRHVCDSPQLARWKKNGLASLHSAASLAWPGWSPSLGSFLSCPPLWKREKKISIWRWPCAWRRRTKGRSWEAARRRQHKDILMCSQGRTWGTQGPRPAPSTPEGPSAYASGTGAGISLMLPHAILPAAP